ncbi:hypothetical protein QBC36DRAFT_241715 [Triangularia setosa]|uniref:Uncharacterized protein n=1 Tax=Triangularia setosa TaxID=2587417 RepID=A0AAN7A7F5_9PEZI|nr:hypothetical protein QBC36DRAFT_241715 [Podospora setosa]
MKLSVTSCILLLAALDAHAAQARALGAEADPALFQLSERQAYRVGGAIPGQNEISRGRFDASPAKRDDFQLKTRAYRVGGAIPGQNEVSRGRFDAGPAKRDTFSDLQDMIADMVGKYFEQDQVQRRQAESTAIPIDDAPRPIDTAIPVPDAPPAPIDTAVPDTPPAPIDTTVPDAPAEVIDTQIPVAPVPTLFVTEVPVVQIPDGFVTAIRVRQNTAVNGGNAGQAGEATAVVGEPSRPVRTDFAIVANVIYE